MKKIILISCLVLLITSCATIPPKKCPACGSTSWEKVETVRGKYSLSKGLIGRAAIGPFGLFAGKSPKQKVYFCQDCKFTCTY